MDDPLGDTDQLGYSDHFGFFTESEATSLN